VSELGWATDVMFFTDELLFLFDGNKGPVCKFVKEGFHFARNGQKVG
jgi:hypothetical protein